MPGILVFAGPNGSGKSTITSEIDIVGQYVNADEIKKDLNCSDLEAAQIADKTREYLLDNYMDFTFETVLSTMSKIKFLSRAKAQGYRIYCIYILTSNPKINVDRVNKRVYKGGHSVPPDKIIKRYIRALKLIPQLISICDEMYIFDNSTTSSEYNRSLIVESKNNHIEIYPNENWDKDMLSELMLGIYSKQFE